MSVIRSRAPNEVAQRIIAAAGQTADLLRVEREDGTPLLSVDVNGNLSTSGTVGGVSIASGLVGGVDVAALRETVEATAHGHPNQAIVDLIDQDLRTAASPTFAGASIGSADIASTVRYGAEADFVVFVDGGAVCAKRGTDGSITASGSDASLVLQHTIDNLPAGGGRIVIRGEMPLTATLRVDRQSVTIEGAGLGDEIAGGGASLVRSGSWDGDLISVSAHYFTLRGVALRNGSGYKDVATGDAVSIVGSMYHEVSKCRINGFNGAAIYCYNVYGLAARDNAITYCGRTGERAAVHISGAPLPYLSTYVSVADNLIASSTWRAVHIDNTDNSIVVRGNYIEDTTSTNVMANAIYFRSGGAIRDNFLHRSNGDMVIVVGYYAKVSSNIIILSAGVGINLQSSYYATAQANTVEDATYGILAGPDSCIVGNHVLSCSSPGIGCGASGVRVIGNAVAGCSTGGAPNAGIYVYGGAERCVVTANSLKDEQTVPTQTIGVVDLTSSATIADNAGHATEASGSATMLGGTSSVVIDHGLVAAPTRIVVTGSSADTAALFVTNVTATQFTINAPAAVGGNRTIYWRAEA